ncbi:hypothetical protein ACC680_15950 [Rhizobium ruizarguesonis]
MFCPGSEQKELRVVIQFPRTSRPELVADMIEGKYDLMRRVEQRAMLDRYIETVLPDIESDEERFRSLARQLKDIELARRNATESVALAQSWACLLATTRLGNPYCDPAARRQRPSADRQERRAIADPAEPGLAVGTERAHHRARRVLGKRDKDLPERSRFSRSWVRKSSCLSDMAETGAGEKRLDFDTDAADIRVGRKRAAAKLVAQRLEN